MKYLPLVWAAVRRNPLESLLMLLAMTVAFTLFGSMIALDRAYDRIISAVRMDRLSVRCAFRCSGLPVGYGRKVRPPVAYRAGTCRKQFCEIGKGGVDDPVDT